MNRLRGLYARFEHLVHETLKFGAVGGFGVVVNILVFNVCLYQLDLAPVRSSIISTAVAIGVNYIGNRFWAFRHRKSADQRREVLLFLAFSGVGMAIEAGAVAISHYLCEFRSSQADNVAKYAVGLPLGTLFRFWSYRTWVFTGAIVTPEQLESEKARLLEAEATGTRR